MRARKTTAQIAEALKCPADGGQHDRAMELADSTATRPCYVFKTRASSIKVCHHVVKCNKCRRLLRWSIPGAECPELQTREAS